MIVRLIGQARVEMTARVMTMRGLKKSSLEIAREVGLSRSTVEALSREARKAGEEGAVLHDAETHKQLQARGVEIARAARAAKMEPRVCLKCRDVFSSWGVGNRRCDPCKGKASEDYSGDPLPMHATMTIGGRRA